MSVELRSEQTAIRTDLGAIFVSMELSRSVWLITSLSPGAGETMSKHSVRAGDVSGLLTRFAQLQEKARARTGQMFPIIAVQEAGLDGFWLHRVLESEGIESHVVDPASIAVSRRCRRAKTDKIDGEALVRTLLAYKRGSRGCVPWSGRRHLRRRTSAASTASARCSPPSGSSTSTASRDCCSRRGSATMSPCTATAGQGSTSS